MAVKIYDKIKSEVEINGFYNGARYELFMGTSEISKIINKLKQDGIACEYSYKTDQIAAA
jgi:hypothetical protein